MSGGALLFLVLVIVPTAFPSTGDAADVPVAGRRITLREGKQRTARVLVRDAAVAAPFPDPTAGAALVVSGGVGPGQCRAEIPLGPGGWRPIGGNGTRRGWRYRAAAPGTGGTRRVVLRPGRLVMSARGAGWPCDLTADAQRTPVTVELRLTDTRWCAAFGEPVERNVKGRFAARNTPAPPACPATRVHVASLNILHGLFCPPATAACRLADRIALLFQWIAASGCPDVVTLQEFQPGSMLALVEPHLATTCPFTYQARSLGTVGVDDALFLSRHPMVASETQRLYKNFRHLTRVRIDHPAGPLDVFSTHLASGSDGAQNPCGADCPPECLAAGAATVRECQGVQVAALAVIQHADVARTPAVVTGDFNVSPGSFVYDHLLAQGFADTYLAVGNPECDPGTGVGCTSGRIDNALMDLESPSPGVNERIDYAFLLPPIAGGVCSATLDPAATRIFADLPNPFAATCGPAPDPICWPSDHEGAEVALDCR